MMKEDVGWDLEDLEAAVEAAEERDTDSDDGDTEDEVESTRPGQLS